MALADVHRFTTDEFLGLDGLAERVELIDGVIYDMSPEGIAHARSQKRIERMLEEALGEHVEIVVGGSIRCPDGFCPIPDVAVYPAGIERAFFEAGDVKLVVEVSVSTIRRDQIKAERYASAGVPRLWIVAPEQGTLTVCEGPVDDRWATTSELAWPDGLAGAVERLAGQIG